MRKALQEYIHLEIGHLDRPIPIAVNPANYREADYIGRGRADMLDFLNVGGPLAA